MKKSLQPRRPLTEAEQEKLDAKRAKFAANAQRNREMSAQSNDDYKNRKL